MTKSILLFHWSPTERRKSINRTGLVPGSLSTDRLWRPPYVAFAGSPSLAWVLSGETDRGRQVEHWDLWTCWTDRLEGYEILEVNGGDQAEYRVYHRIYKRDLWYVGSRSHPPHRLLTPEIVHPCRARTRT